MKLTLIISGADAQEISCPELRFSYFAGEDILDEDLERFYRFLASKSDRIIDVGESCRVKDLVPFAKLFKANQEIIKENILQRKEILIQAD